MQYVNCYNCDTKDSKIYDKENGFSYAKCTSCGLVYLNPQPNSEEIGIAHRMGMHRSEKLIQVTGK